MSTPTAASAPNGEAFPAAGAGAGEEEAEIVFVEPVSRSEAGNAGPGVLDLLRPYSASRPGESSRNGIADNAGTRGPP